MKNLLKFETSPYLLQHKDKSRALAALERGNARARQKRGETNPAQCWLRGLSLVPCNGP